MPSVEEQLRLRKLKSIRDFLSKQLQGATVSERKALVRSIINFLLDEL